MTRRRLALESTAYHEAGHTVAAWKVGVRLKALTIVSSDKAQGRLVHAPYFGAYHPDFDGSPRVQRCIENMVLVCLAGPAAQRRFNARTWRSFHGSSDYREAVDLLLYLTGSSEEVKAYLQLIEIRAEALVAQRELWVLIEAVARALLECREMSGAEVRAVIRERFKTILPQEAVHMPG